MKKIKIICGTYGFRPEPHTVELKTADDAPFLVEDAEADRLAALKVAVIVDSTAAPAPSEDPPASPSPDPDPDDDAGDGALVYNEDMKLEELKDVARNVGATEDELKSLRSKKDVIALIDSLLAGGPDHDAPQIGAADPV